MWSKELVELLIKKYQECEHLYNVQDVSYMDRIKRFSSFNNIYKILREKEPKLTLEDIKKKIHTLRSQYIKEVREVEKSKINGDVCVPKLWCFNQLEFLRNHCQSRKSTSSINANDINKTDLSLPASDQINLTQLKRVAEGEKSSSSPCKRKKCSHVNINLGIQNIKNLIQERLKQKAEDYDWLGQQVVFELSSIKNESIRRETAWKIQTVLREGLLSDSAASTEKPSKLHSICFSSTANSTRPNFDLFADEKL